MVVKLFYIKSKPIDHPHTPEAVDLAFLIFVIIAVYFLLKIGLYQFKSWAQEKWRRKSAIMREGKGLQDRQDRLPGAESSCRLFSTTSSSVR